MAIHTFLLLIEHNFFFPSSVERVPWIADGEPCQQAWMCYEPPVSTETGPAPTINRVAQ